METRADRFDPKRHKKMSQARSEYFSVERIIEEAVNAKKSIITDTRAQLRSEAILIDHLIDNINSRREHINRHPDGKEDDPLFSLIAGYVRENYVEYLHYAPVFVFFNEKTRRREYNYQKLQETLDKMKKAGPAQDPRSPAKVQSLALVVPTLRSEDALGVIFLLPASADTKTQLTVFVSQKHWNQEASAAFADLVNTAFRAELDTATVNEYPLHDFFNMKSHVIYPPIQASTLIKLQGFDVSFRDLANNPFDARSQLSDQKVKTRFLALFSAGFC